MARPHGFAQTSRQRAAAKIANTTHGMSHTPTYVSWNSMRQRCLNPKNPNYRDYGGRGIVCCDRWSSFEAFLADMGVRPAGTTLEREDNDGNYEPGNCRWATPTSQSRNRRNNLRITHEGETLLLADWSRRLGVDAGTLRREYLRDGELRRSTKGNANV